MKLKYIKKTSLLALISIILILPSCTNLDETIYSEISVDNYEFKDKDIQSMFSSVYSSMRGVYWGWNGLFDLEEESSDCIMTPLRIGIGWGDLYVTMHKHTYHSSIDHFWTNWYNCYQGINSCNQLLDREIVQKSVSSCAQLRAYRALFYYILFDNFRNIPLEVTYNHEKGYLPKQADPQTTFDFIISELNDIKDDLKENDIYGQLNNYAVSMILAKMYLNHNAWFNTDDDTYYQKAYDEVNEVISGGKYSLAVNYTDPFKEDDSSCSEVIFAIPYDYTYATGNYLANKALHGASKSTFGLAGSPWNGSCAVPQFIDTYDSDDSRLEDTWLIGNQLDQDGKQIMVDNDPFIYTKSVHSIDNPGAYPMEGARFHKYEIVAGKHGTSADDVPFFRLTDAYMIKAECLLRLGSYNGETKQTAADIVTTIRARAFKNNPNKALRTVAELEGGSCYAYGHSENIAKLGENDNIITTSEGGDDIELGGFLDELAWEFVGEHHRRQDLIRFRLTSKNMNVYNGKSWFCKDAETDETDLHKDIFPIFHDFIEANSNLVQNPGY
ncbi:MAG: RagB/SusD family nutrient uptake outer membrane protein [Bacteroidales bacterium]